MTQNLWTNTVAPVQCARVFGQNMDFIDAEEV